MSNPYLTAFNNLVIKFTDDIIYIFPEDNDFRVYKRGIEMLNSANAKKICLLFKNYSAMYRNEIIKNDEVFFINNDYNNVLDNLEQKQGIETIINKLKCNWTRSGLYRLRAQKV